MTQRYAVLLILPESQMKGVPVQCMASIGPAGISSEHDYSAHLAVRHSSIVTASNNLYRNSHLSGYNASITANLMSTRCSLTTSEVILEAVVPAHLHTAGMS